jgi:hypothetical protein
VSWCSLAHKYGSDGKLVLRVSVVLGQMSTEQTPLIAEDNSHGYDSAQSAEPVIAKKPTPLPKLQLLSVLYIQFGEPITATVIYPFIVCISL